MLITDRSTPLITSTEIKCFKVMVQWKTGFYTCPPAFQHFLNNKIGLIEYHLNEFYRTESTDPNKDYRIDGVIGAGFFHTFCDLKSAQVFAKKINDKLINPHISHHPELYIIPQGAKIVILKAIIPENSLYYEGAYQGEKNKICEKTYASNQIVYNSIVDTK